MCIVYCLKTTPLYDDTLFVTTPPAGGWVALFAARRSDTVTRWLRLRRCTSKFCSVSSGPGLYTLPGQSRQRTRHSAAPPGPTPRRSTMSNRSAGCRDCNSASASSVHCGRCSERTIRTSGNSSHSSTGASTYRSWWRRTLTRHRRHLSNRRSCDRR